MMAILGFIVVVVIFCNVISEELYQGENMYFKKLFIAAFALTLTFVFADKGYTTDSQESPELLFQKTRQWSLPYKPLDMVQSADGNMLFFLTENNRVLIYSSDGTLKGSIPVDKGISRIDTDIRGENILLMDQENNTFTSISFDFIKEIDTTGSPYLGNENAKVTIAVFTNFQCPYCRQLEPLLTQVLEQNKETIKIVFKHMPLRGRDLSDLAALGSFAADNQGKFWEYHDQVFSHEDLSEQLLDEIAAGIGLDMDKFKADRDSPQARQRLSKDAKDAQDAGVRGTPTVFINGQLLKNRSPQGFQSLIDKKLSEAK